MASNVSEDEDDPVLDFFDFSKPRREIRLLEGYRPSPVVPLPNPEEHHVEEDYEEEEYWHEPRMRAERAMASARVRTDPTESADGDQGGVFASRMSEMEANTLAGSSRMGDGAFHPGGRAAADHESSAELYARYTANASRTNPAAANLSISKVTDEIIKALDNHQVVIVTGHTGCGKSTQVPQYIMDYQGGRNKPFNIVVTQPRRIAAQSLAKRVCQERGIELGTLIGYKIGLEKAQVSKDTRLLYCTTGVLKKMIISKKAVHDFTHIILDEVHEREEDMDFILLLVKHFINTNSRGVKLILMSATIDTSRFLDYFGTKIQSSALRNWPGQIAAPQSRQYTISKLYLDNLMECLPRGTLFPSFDQSPPALHPVCVEVCTVIVSKLDELENSENRRSPGTALIFLPGEAEIQTVGARLAKAGGTKWRILMLHSRIPVEDINQVFEPDHAGRRKVILSTNIAESSLTIPDVEYVIDFCLTKLLEADPDTNYVSLKMHWADKNNCTQRSGRAGRVKNGRVYRLVPNKFYNTFEEQHRPGITRAPLDKVILDAKLLDLEELGTPKDILALAMDPPELRNIHKTILHLKEIGALLTTVKGVARRDDGDLTLLGELMASLPVDVRLGKLVLLGHVLGVFEECIIIAAGLSNKSIFSTPMDQKLAAYFHKLVWANQTFSDCFAVLIAYTTWSELKAKGHLDRRTGDRFSYEQKWCFSRFLQLKSLNDMSRAIEEIKLGLRHQHIEDFVTPNREPLSDEERFYLLQYAIFGAFYPNYFVSKTPDLDLLDAVKTINGLPLENTVYLQGFPIDQAKMGEELYAADIKKIFEVCGPSDRMDVTFSNSKVYIEFAPNDDADEVDPRQEVVDLEDLRLRSNITGEIIQQVYVALKLRDDRLRAKDMFLKTFSFHDASEVFEEKKRARELRDSGRNFKVREFKPRVSEVKLRGPYSPLEFKLACVHQMGAIKEIRIEPESVNSVLLNRYPTEQVSQWLVAAHVGLNPSSSALQLRSTTFMPAWPGLGAILAMIFAPFVEMRADQKRTRYSGCLLGLGHRPYDWGRGERTGGDPSGAQRNVKQVAFHPDHDMEIEFDVSFQQEDLHSINKIRYYLNKAFSRERETRTDGATMTLAQRRIEGLTKFSNVNDLMEIRKEIHQNLSFLLDRDRAAAPLVFFPKRCAWDQVPKEEKLDGYTFEKEETEKFIWKMIDPIEVVEDQ